MFNYNITPMIDVYNFDGDYSLYLGECLIDVSNSSSSDEVIDIIDAETLDSIQIDTNTFLSSFDHYLCKIDSIEEQEFGVDNKVAYLWIIYNVDVYYYDYDSLEWVLLDAANNFRAMEAFHGSYSAVSETGESELISNFNFTDAFNSSQNYWNVNETLVDTYDSNKFYDYFSPKAINDIDFCYETLNFENQFQFDSPSNRYMENMHLKYGLTLLIPGLIFSFFVFCYFFRFIEYFMYVAVLFCFCTTFLVSVNECFECSIYKCTRCVFKASGNNGVAGSPLELNGDPEAINCGGCGGNAAEVTCSGCGGVACSGGGGGGDCNLGGCIVM